MPDLLYQIKKGVWSHLLDWYKSLLIDGFDIWTANGYLDEIDKWFTLVPCFQGIKQFPNGICNLKNITAGEYADIIKVIAQYFVATT